MTKEEVKEIFDHNWTKLVNPDYSDDDLAEAQNWVIETLSAELQGFEEYLNQYLGENDLKIIGNDVWEETKAKAEQTEWISVKKHGNPKEDDLYMVTVRGGFEETENEYVTTSHYIFDRGGWSVEDVDTEVTAWMPKPSPYKGE